MIMIMWIRGDHATTILPVRSKNRAKNYGMRKTDLKKFLTWWRSIILEYVEMIIIVSIFDHVIK